MSETMSLSAAAMGELLSGEYTDPNLYDCPRTIAFPDPAAPESFTILGYDADSPEGEMAMWTGTGVLNPDNTLTVCPRMELPHSRACGRRSASVCSCRIARGRVGPSRS